MAFFSTPFKMLKSKYDDLEPYLAENKEKDILDLIRCKENKRKTTNSKKHNDNGWFNTKTKRLTIKEEEELFKIANRDIFYGNEMEKVEIGEVFQIGTFVKEKKK